MFFIILKMISHERSVRFQVRFYPVTLSAKDLTYIRSRKKAAAASLKATPTNEVMSVSLEGGWYTYSKNNKKEMLTSEYTPLPPTLGVITVGVTVEDMNRMGPTKKRRGDHPRHRQPKSKR